MAGLIPVPDNCAVCCVSAALSFTVKDPVRAPSAVGVKVTEIAQEDLAARLLGATGQVEFAAKSPEVEIPVMVSGTVWLLTRVIVLAALVVLAKWLPNASVAGVRVTAAAPVPLNCVVCGLVPTLSVTDSTPVCGPRIVGLNVTPILQVPFGANLFGARGQFVVSEKLPVAEMLLIVSGPALPFAKTRIVGPLEVPTMVLAKATVEGLNV